jgi:hypothetical protein
MEFQHLWRRAVIGRFDGGKISSDAGGVLLREVEKRTAIIKREDFLPQDRSLPLIPPMTNIKTKASVMCSIAS